MHRLDTGTERGERDQSAASDNLDKFNESDGCEKRIVQTPHPATPRRRAPPAIPPLLAPGAHGSAHASPRLRGGVCE